MRQVGNQELTTAYDSSNEIVVTSIKFTLWKVFTVASIVLSKNNPSCDVHVKRIESAQK